MAKSPSAAKKKRVRRRPEQARQHILDAAVQVISRQGPEAAGLKQIAAAAGVSHALITHYFGTYEALVDASVMEAMNRLRARLVERIVSAPDPTPEAVVRLYIDTALEPWYGRLVSWALFSDYEGSGNFADRLVPDMKLIADATEQLLAGRLNVPLTRSQTEALIVTVWSMVVGYVAANGFFWRALGRKPGPRRDRDLREAVGALARSMFG